MGAGTSKKDDDTSIRDATTRGPITFDDATLHFVKGGPPPPPSETSTRLQPQWNEAFMRLTQKAREKQASRAMSTKEALDAFKARFGESAFVEAFGSEDKYLKSIVRPVTVSGTSSKLWHLGDREYDIRSEHAQAIQALDAQPTGAAILPAPGGAAGAGGDATRPWDGLELTPSVSPERDASLNHWKAWFDSDETPNQTLWNGGAWPADEEPPEWNDFGAPHGAPPAVRRPQQIASYYRGPRPAGLASKTRMTKALCGNDPTMLALWAHAEFYSQVRARYDAELAASRAMWAKWRAQSGGSGDGRATRGLERRSHDPKDAYAALTRKKTEELIENDLRAWYKRHKGALMGQLAHNEPLLKAIAEDVGVPRCVLTARDVNDRTHLLSPAIKVNFPGLGSQLVTSNYDHVDKGWKDDPSVAIRELGFRRLIWGKLNKKLPGYEWYLAHDAERLYLDAYLESSLCFDSSFGEHWVFEFPIKDEPAWWAKTTKDQQHSELSYIVNHLLKGAILGATEGRFRVEATGRDAELLRILKQRFGAGLEFEHAPSSKPWKSNIGGQFRASTFMDRGATYFSIDHVALGCVRRKGVLYRIVGVRGLLPQDMNFYASGYEFIKVLGLEAWVEEYRKNAYCEVGVGDLDASEAVFDYRPDVFQQGGMRPV